ncbi:MAG: tetratricopeptide repeat protein [Agarilytica sp.]
MCLALLHGCSSNQESSGPTLADIDTASPREYQRKKSKPNNKDVSATAPELKKKSREDIRKAYRSYVEKAASNDTSRQKALTRLAQLELELSDSLKSETDTEDSDLDISQSLKRTISLLETTLRDYPDAKNNDTVMYQLAQAYDRAGRYSDSIATLEILASKYNRSPYYPEAQFRIGEAVFARGDYIAAEDAYTEVILSPSSEKFYEKSLFKRGWTRYKQQLYAEALNDYVDAVEFHQFEPYKNLTASEKSQFSEYFRAIGLAFSYTYGQLSIDQFFASRNNFPYLYLTYSTVSDIFLAQKRFSDAAKILTEFSNSNRLNPNAPDADQKIIAAWREGGFTSKVFASIEQYYTRYQPGANYWKNIADETTLKDSQNKMREYLTQVSSYHHDRYQNKSKAPDFERANLWYSRYLKHFSAYANKDNIYALYAELLMRAKQKQGALKYFALAAYDDDIVLDKKAAYSTIVLTSDLVAETTSEQGKTKWLDQHLKFALRFIELYPTDARSESIAKNAAERAYTSKQYDRTITIANFIPDAASSRTHHAVDQLKARAYLETAQYPDAEAVFMELLDSPITTRKQAGKFRDSIALSIYRQAELAKKDGAEDLALSNFTRIVKIAPHSELASTGLYDAVAMSMQNKSWNQAIVLIQEFQARYPKHKFAKDVSKKLSVAYLNSDQKGKAAQEFEKIAKFENNLEVKMAAQWQAAQLYQTKNDVDGAIRAFRDYAHTYQKPYAQNLEAMYTLSELYKKKGDYQKRYFWQNKIQKSDQRATKGEKTDRTTYIASTTILDLANQQKREYQRRKLVEPIALNLKRKKSSMQASVKLYGKASSYGVQTITTESTHAIGDIYRDFSQSLLDSERPKNLNDDELEQYEILLEDQAFPFEEKAIEFYETNLSRTAENTYDKWIGKSFKELETLFPVRYQRKGKVDAYRE